MLGIIALCLIVGICVLMYCRSWLLESRAHPLPPAYPGLLPVIGHAHLLLTDTAKLWRLLKDIFEHCMQHGGITYAKVGPEVYYCISDPEDALVVANTCLKKHFIHSFAKYWLGEGLVTGSGDHWHRHRQMLKSSFSLPIVNGYLEVFNSQAKTMLDDIECSVGKGKFDASPHFQQYALRSSYLTSFGKHADDEKSYLKYMKAANDMLYLLMERFQKFWLHSDFIHTLLGYKKQESELLKSVNEILDERIQTTKSIMNIHNDRPLSANVSYQPLLDLMLQLPTKNRFTDQEITEELHTAIVAGFETTSGSLQSILVMIGSFPKVQDRMYEEIMQVVGTDRDLDKEDIRKLVYTEAVIKESLRLIPTVPVIVRYIDRDVKLKNYTMRAGSQCFINTYGLHRHPSWGPDVDQFRPERWLDAASLPPNKATDATFSFGKRSCLGKTYAMNTMKVAVAHIVRKFVITADHTKLRFKLDMTLKSVTGHEISFERRNWKTVMNKNIFY